MNAPTARGGASGLELERPADGGCSDDDARTWVIIAAYNESRSIGEVLTELARWPYRVVVVDDGSVDDTFSVARRFTKTVLRHTCNLGQGAAIQTGITYALRQRNATYLVTFDADGQHDPRDIPRLVAPLKSGEYDITLGSRFLADGSAVDIPRLRRIVLAVATLMTRFSTGLALTDTHNGLRAFTAAAASQLTISQNRMAHGSQILSQIAALDLRYREVPVTVTYTSDSLAKGQSLGNIVNIFWELVKERAR